MGLGHGHQDVVGLNDPTLVLNKDSLNTRTTSKLFIYNKIDGKNADSFHFHGDMDIYPVSAFVFVPDNGKSSAIIRGRFEAGELPYQIIVPTKIVDHLLQNIFRIKYIFKTVFVLVGVATLLILVQIVMLSLRLRKNEIHTMFTMGSSRNKVIEILGTELFMLVLISSAVAAILYYITGFFIDDFIHYFIL
jgi:putative ABC transport system permease protein